VVLAGLTDGSGQITMSRVFSGDQPVVGRVRKSSSAPYYKTQPLLQEVDSAAGLTFTVQLLPDA
jgi:hypothetical protein